MENLDGIIGSIAIAVFREGLKKDTTICLIVSWPLLLTSAELNADTPRPRHRKISGELRVVCLRYVISFRGMMRVEMLTLCPGPWEIHSQSPRSLGRPTHLPADH